MGQALRPQRTGHRDARRQTPQRAELPWRAMFKWVGAGAAVATAVAAVVLTFSGTTYLQVEGRSGLVRLEMNPDAEIAWELDGAELRECAGDSTVGATLDLEEGQSIGFAAARPGGPAAQVLPVATVRVDSGVVLVKLSASLADVDSIRCSGAASAAVFLDRGDGTRRGLRLPALLQMPKERIRDGLMLEFRGALRLGDELLTSRHPVVYSGRVSMRERRPDWAGSIASSSYFDLETRDLGIGDRLNLLPVDGAAQPEGYLRISAEEKGPELSVTGAALAARAEIFRPTSRAQPERLHVNGVKVASRDDLVQLLLGLLAAVWTLGASIYPLLPESTGRRTASS